MNFYDDYRSIDDVLATNDVLATRLTCVLSAIYFSLGLFIPKYQFEGNFPVCHPWLQSSQWRNIGYRKTSVTLKLSFTPFVKSGRLSILAMLLKENMSRSSIYRYETYEKNNLKKIWKICVSFNAAISYLRLSRFLFGA